MASRNVLGQKFWSLILAEEVGVDFFYVSAADEVVWVDAGLADYIADRLDVGVVVIAQEAEALSALKSQLSFDAGVEFVSEGFEEDDQLDVQTSRGLGLLEEDDFDESVDV